MIQGQTSLAFTAPTDADLPAVLNRIAEAIQHLSAEFSWPSSTEYKINLILEELTMNTISYASDGAGTPADLEILITPHRDGAVLRYSDSGTPFDPLTQGPPPKDAHQQGDTIQVGGLGILLIKNMAGAIDYLRTPGRNNVTVQV